MCHTSVQVLINFQVVEDLVEPLMSHVQLTLVHLIGLPRKLRRLVPRV